MHIFENIVNFENPFNDFIKKINEIEAYLSNYCSDELSQISKIKKLFIEKTSDFLRDDRKLNIGIIGQVKTGRSTFLNTFLFKGESILPKDVTPKTVTVTKILYSNKNYIEIEYYSKSEWNTILVASESSESISKEIIDMVKERKLNPDDFINKKTEIIETNSYDDLKGILNDYIGENGLYTPFIKNITLHINNPNLKDLCIFDTPGINDPIISRTNRTKEFLEKCDVVFFLSRSSQFLDKVDIDILSSILPQKGVKKLVLICSRFDDGLNDTLLSYNSFEEAVLETKKTLTIYSELTFNKLIENYKKNNASRDLIQMLKNCYKPIFISSKAHTMSKKNFNSFTESEKKVYDNLNYFNNIDSKVLEDIGNYSEIDKLFKSVVNEKELTLQKKGESFIPDTALSIKLELENIKNIYYRRINMLSFNSKDEIDLQKQYMLSKSNEIKKSLDILFDDFCEDIDKNKDSTLEILNNTEPPILEELEGNEKFVKDTEIKSSSWYNPFSWGKTETKEIVSKEKYTYINVADALDKIESYAGSYKHSIDENLENAVEVDELKNKLLNTLLENYDLSDENFDPLFYKLIVKKTLDSITLPYIDIDIESILSLISEKFSGEVRNTSDKNSMKILFSYCVKNFNEETFNKFESEINNFKNNLLIVKDTFYNALYNNINSEFNLLENQFNNRKHEIKLQKQSIEALDYCNTLL